MGFIFLLTRVINTKRSQAMSSGADSLLFYMVHIEDI